jgi:hypothetical protein
MILARLGANLQENEDKQSMISKSVKVEMIETGERKKGK